MKTDATFRSDMTVKLIDRLGTDNSIIRAAKVSTGRDHDETTDPGRLLDYLMRNRHLSPVEHCTITFRIEAPIFVWREFMRHRTLSFNERSGRYMELEPVFYIPGLFRNLVQEGKPGEYTFSEGTPGLHAYTAACLRAASLDAYDIYQDLLDRGVAREVARMVLPVSTYSAAYVTGNLRNWLKFLSLCTINEDSLFPSYPQREIEMVAEEVESLLSELYPHTLYTWDACGRVGA